jgi:hypothetical protein
MSIKTASFLRLFTIIGMLALVATLLPAGSVRAQSGTVFPPTGSAGDRLTFTAAGFEPGERVDIWATAPTGVSYPRYPSVSADADGGALWTWDIAADQPAGAWTMAARGIRSNVRIGIGFSVLPGPGRPAPATTVTPERGEPGATFRFSATGFRPGERVGAWLSSPDGATIDLDPGKGVTISADDIGLATWQWRSPVDARGGTWIARARGVLSSYEVAIPFSIAADPPPAPNISVNPPSGGPGTTFSFTIGSFPPAEELGSFLIQPDGAQVDGVPYFRADDTGTATWSWTAPADAPAGAWRAVTRELARGRVGAREVAIDFALTGTTTPPPVAAGPTASVDPAEAPQGSTFTFSFNAMPAGEELRFGLTDPDNLPVAIGDRVDITANGSATWNWTAPTDAQPGVWTLTARSQRTRAEAQVRFTITSDAPPPAGVSPERGPPGTTFTFYGSGFRKDELVGYWLNTPDRTIIPFAEPLVADADGRVFVQLEAQADTPRGLWTLVLQSSDNANNRRRNSDVTYVIRFIVE